MKRVIYKYEIETRTDSISIPKYHQILDFQIQDNKLVFWALIDSKEVVYEELKIEVFYTGEEIYYDTGIEREHLKTLQHGRIVMHIFKRI